MSFHSGISWLITGANRGLGLEFTKQILAAAQSNTVYATCRNPESATALKAMTEDIANKDRLYVVKMDIDSTESVNGAAAELTKIIDSKGIDYILNNAAWGHHDKAFDIDADRLAAICQTNVCGAVRVSNALLSLLEQGNKRTIVNVSTHGASIGLDATLLYASYCISKAALNMLTYKQAKQRPDLTVISLAPGRRATDMGGAPGAPVDEGVRDMLKVINELTPASSGKFFDFAGREVPW